MCVGILISAFRVGISNFGFIPFWVGVGFLRFGLEFLSLGLQLFGFGAQGLGVWGCALQLTFWV